MELQVTVVQSHFIYLLSYWISGSIVILDMNHDVSPYSYLYAIQNYIYCAVEYDTEQLYVANNYHVVTLTCKFKPTCPERVYETIGSAITREVIVSRVSDHNPMRPVMPSLCICAVLFYCCPLYSAALGSPLWSGSELPGRLF